MHDALVNPHSVAGLFLLGSLWIVAGAPAHAAAAILSLPRPLQSGRMPVEGALKARRSIRSFAPDALRLADVSQLLWAAQGITGPEGKRAAPSAGALYPIELFLVIGRVEGAEPAVYRYRPESHDLALVVEGDRRGAVAGAAHGQQWIADAPALLVAAAVVERTRGKYGTRAERYVQIEAGAAAENVALQAVALGLGTVVVGAFDDGAVARAVGMGGERPLVILPVGRPR